MDGPIAAQTRTGPFAPTQISNLGPAPHEPLRWWFLLAGSVALETQTLAERNAPMCRGIAPFPVQARRTTHPTRIRGHCKAFLREQGPLRLSSRAGRGDEAQPGTCPTSTQGCDVVERADAAAG
jgi:hypothetical protein